MWVTNTGFVMGLISHPFVSSDNFRIIFFSFGDSIVMLNWLHANGVSLKFLIKRFGFEFWVYALLKKPRNSESVVNVENQKVFKVKILVLVLLDQF